MPRVLTVTARYPGAEADALFAGALSFAEMAEASAGVARYHGLPEGEMQEGRGYVLDVTVWGVMRNPAYQVHVERVDRAARRVQSREAGWMIQRWDHALEIDPAESGAAAVWTDRILIDCGWATPFMVRVARALYRHRHRARGGRDITARIARP